MADARGQWPDRLPSLFPALFRMSYIPQFNFNGGHRQWTKLWYQQRSFFFNYNRTFDIADNFSKIVGRHALKNWPSTSNTAGRIRRCSPMPTATSTSSTRPVTHSTPDSVCECGDRSFQTFNQRQNIPPVSTRYTNFEFYLQDMWKIRPRLTADYGCASTISNHSTTGRCRLRHSCRACLIDPKRHACIDRSSGTDPVTVRPTYALLSIRLPDRCCGTEIGDRSGSGDLLNGIAKAGDKISKYLQDSSRILFAPRLGLAYDLTGKGNYVLRGGAGIFYDRFQGNETFDMLGNPPTIFTPTVSNGRLQDITAINNVNTALLAPSGLNAFAEEGFIPTVYQFNIGLQAKLPYQFRIDMSYVGSQSRHLLQRLNLNAIPYGALYKRENQDPSRFAGGVVPAVELTSTRRTPLPG